MDEIRTKSRIVDGIKEKCVWRGKLERVPHVDDYVVVHEGWASNPVLEVHFNIYDGSVLIYIHPDLYGEYPEA